MYAIDEADSDTQEGAHRRSARTAHSTQHTHTHECTPKLLPPPPLQLRRDLSAGEPASELPPPPPPPPQVAEMSEGGPARASGLIQVMRSFHCTSPCYTAHYFILLFHCILFCYAARHFTAQSRIAMRDRFRIRARNLIYIYICMYIFRYTRIAMRDRSRIRAPARLPVSARAARTTPPGPAGAAARAGLRAAGAREWPKSGTMKRCGHIYSFIHFQKSTFRGPGAREWPRSGAPHCLGRRSPSGAGRARRLGPQAPGPMPGLGPPGRSSNC